MSFTQVLNLRPFDQSFLAFLLFTILMILVLVSCVGIIRQTKLVRRVPDFVREPAYGLGTRLAAAGVLVVTLPVYGGLAVLFDIPNTWPVEVRAGADARSANPWIAPLQAHSVDLGLDEQAARLFVPDKRIFLISRRIYYVTIINRSTVPSPPMIFRFTLHATSGSVAPPAVFAAAVATRAVHRWLPFGDLSRLPVLSHWIHKGGIFGGLPPAPDWLGYAGFCDQTPIGSALWCFTRPPDVRHDWREPELRLPSIPSRDSREIYLEFASLRELSTGGIPATLELHAAVEGQFPVNLRRDVELSTGGAM